MNKTILFLLAILLLPIVSQAKTINSSGNKPQWVTKGANSLNNKRSNTTYFFIVVPNTGPNLQHLQERKVKALGDRIASENQLEGVESLGTENVQDGNTYSTVTYTDKVTNQKKTKVFYYKVIDEYWEWDGVHYNYYTLFAVSDNGQQPQFDNFSFSSTYGVAPAVMSIIPGLGQFYKGSTVKGICMLAGVAACGVGALFCENERSDYKNKMKEQPQFAQTYNTKANNYQTARNVCLGAAAAVWLYNIIDAATAKGARRIIVKPSNGNYISVHPVATPNSFGVSMAYNF